MPQSWSHCAKQATDPLLPDESHASMFPDVDRGVTGEGEEKEWNAELPRLGLLPMLLLLPCEVDCRRADALHEEGVRCRATVLDPAEGRGGRGA